LFFFTFKPFFLKAFIASITPSQKMKKIILSLTLIFIALFSSAQKNTILIIADDLGVDYLSFYANGGDTAIVPNIRSLLATGIQFNNAWANPVCSPTRAAMFTGRYAFRNGVGTVISNASTPQLDTAERSVARLLRDFAPLNYATANVGKWHMHLANPVPQRTFPNYMGYDLYSGNFNGAISDYSNYVRIKNGVMDTVTTYATTQTVNDAMDWLDTLSGQKPFFLWLAFNAPHFPFHKPPNNLHSYSALPGTTNHINAFPELYFKAMVQAMDTEIGRLFQYLDSNNLRDSTNIILIGDNGSDRDVTQLTNINHAKGTLYEGGIHIPMIIAGPAVVNPGRQSDALVSTPDLFATILEISGFSNWINFIPAAKLPVDAISLVPIILNDTTDVRQWIFSEQFQVPTNASDAKAMRTKTHKLIRFDSGAIQFYDLTIDPLEANNLFGQSLTILQTQQYNFLCNELNALLNQNSCTPLSTSLGENEQENDLPFLFPNPTSKLLNVEWKNHENEALILKDAIGKIVKQEKPGVWDVSHLQSGVYFLSSEKTKWNRAMKVFISN